MFFLGRDKGIIMSRWGELFVVELGLICRESEIIKIML